MWWGPAATPGATPAPAEPAPGEEAVLEMLTSNTKSNKNTMNMSHFPIKHSPATALSCTSWGRAGSGAGAAPALKRCPPGLGLSLRLLSKWLPKRC